MSEDQADQPVCSGRSIAICAAVSVLLLWCAQPPWMLWPLALVALVPWLILATASESISRRGYLILWGVSTLYWLVSLQGLRHANVAIYPCWIVLGAYLASFHVLFIAALRRVLAQRVPLIVAAPLVWVGQEWARNYLMTGISVLMLGHSMADRPEMIQIADLLGTYGVSFVLVLVNVAAFSLWKLRRRELPIKVVAVNVGTAVVMVAATIGYGVHRLGEPLQDGSTTWALIQRNEPVEYGQSLDDAVAIFRNYASQSVLAASDYGKRIDAFLWPESMFSGGSPWMFADPDAAVPAEANLDAREFQSVIADRQAYFLERAGYLQGAIAMASPNVGRPYIVAGCGVVHYHDRQDVYSGVISIRPDGKFDDWYGKTHLVMFGEYVPILPKIPGIGSLIPPELGLNTGPGAKRFMVGDTAVAPNICIESAVERVTVKQLASLLERDQLPDLVVTVTNDGWFDDSSVIAHHLRCAQLVAVGCRRPILSAANNGPTAWIDSRGQIVDQLPQGTDGALIATPARDSRTSLYLRIGDWPACGCLIACVILLALPYVRPSSRTEP